ncbi:MAG: hypothetical protein WC797_01285 [Candidatus Paceibacterota bacterium]|jgi:hypothetical protein
MNRIKRLREIRDDIQGMQTAVRILDEAWKARQAQTNLDRSRLAEIESIQTAKRLIEADLQVEADDLVSLCLHGNMDDCHSASFILRSLNLEKDLEKVTSELARRVTDFGPGMDTTSADLLAKDAIEKLDWIDWEKAKIAKLYLSELAGREAQSDGNYTVRNRLQTINTVNLRSDPPVNVMVIVPRP